MTTTQPPRRFDEITDEEQAREESVIPIIGYILDQYEWALGRRIQALIFYIDAIHHRDHGEQLTDANWRAYMYGMYSHDVNRVLETLNEHGGSTGTTIHNGSVVTKFIDPPADYSLDDDTRAFLDEMHEETQDKRTEDLAAWTKNHPLFTATDYDSVVCFADITYDGEPPACSRR